MAKEHSIEVHLPFAQLALGSFKLLPIQIGSLDARGLAALSEALATVLEGKRALLIASTDLSHYPAYEDARRVDREIVEMLEHWRLADLLTAEERAQDANVPDLQCRMCGVTAVVTVMQAAAKLGANKVNVLRCANSGDVPEGDKARCVGYCAAAITKTGGAPPPQIQRIVEETSAMTTPPRDQELNDDQQAYVLELAKRAIDSYVIRREKVVPERREGILGEERAVFVTLNEDGRLRGCIGSLEPQEALVDAVVSRAIAAATQDPRFRPVERAELPKLEIHVSVLSPLRQVSGASEIEIGRHGIIVRQGFRSGVFLPEVATEQGWDLETTLNHLCEGKAGLSADAWRRGADLYVFTTQSIGQE
jgi:AmmeMemoRadiSam system protein A